MIRSTERPHPVLNRTRQVARPNLKQRIYEKENQLGKDGRHRNPWTESHKGGEWKENNAHGWTTQRGGGKGGKGGRGMAKERNTSRLCPLNVRSAADKLTAIQQCISHHDISILVITETHIAEGGCEKIAVMRVRTRKRMLSKSGT